MIAKSFDYVERRTKYSYFSINLNRYVTHLTTENPTKRKKLSNIDDNDKHFVALEMYKVKY